MGQECFYESELQSVVVPEGVTSLGTSCFNRCYSLVSAVLPSTLQTVPQYCFYQCTSLTDLTLTPGIQTLYTQCFYGCTGLTEVTIPASVTSFGNQSKPFAECSNINQITLQWTEIPQAFRDRIPFDDSVVSGATFIVPTGYEQAYATALGITTDNINPSLLGRVFTAEVSGQTVTFKVTDDEAKLCQVGDGTNPAVDATFAGTLSMPASVTYMGQQFAVTKVGDSAFKNCALTGFGFGSVTEVGAGAFMGSSLTSLDLAGVTTIASEAFRSCHFTSVDLSGVATVGSWAFADGSLQSVTFSPNAGFDPGPGGTIISGLRRRVGGLGGSNGPSSIGEGSFSSNSISSLSFDDSSISSVPNNAFSHNNISELNLGDVESVGDYSFYDNDLSYLNTKNVRHMGKEAFGQNHFTEIDFGPGSETSTDWGDTPVDNPFGDISELGGLTTIVAGGAPLAAMEYFWGQYGSYLATGLVVYATLDTVWRWLMGKRKKQNQEDQDDINNRDRIAFGFADSPDPTETCVDTYLPYNIQKPDGVDVDFETENCSIDQENKLIRAGSSPGQASITARFYNRPGLWYEVKTITLSFNVSDTDDCDPDKDKIPTMTFIDRNVTVPRFATYNVRVNYTNMTKEEASRVVFALKANPASDSFLDISLLNYMSVTKKEDTDGTVNGGWPYVEITTSWSPVSMMNLIGFARYLTATLDVQRYRPYHLTDETAVVAMETPNPNIYLYTDTVQVGDVIALPRFCDFFPTCWALSPVNIPASEVISVAGYQRYSQDEHIFSSGSTYHRGVPLISYCNEQGLPVPGGGVTAASEVLYSRSKVLLGGSGSSLDPDHEEMVDTVFVKARQAGTTIIRFTDPYFANMYFNMRIVSVAPQTTAPQANPCEWDFTHPLAAAIKDDGLRGSTLTKSTASYWNKKGDDYYYADMGYYGLDFGSSDRKWAPFFMNNGQNMPWFEGIEQSVLTQPEDDVHTSPANKQWHTAKDHIRLLLNRSEGEPQVAFVGQTDLRIKKPANLQTGEHRGWVPFVVKASPLNSNQASPSVICTYTYTDETNAQQTYTETFVPTSTDQEFEFRLYGTVGSYINLSLCDVELSGIRIDAPLTFAEQPKVYPTYEDGIYKSGTEGTYWLGSDGAFYLWDADSETYQEISEEELFSVPYFEFKVHTNDLVKLEKCNSLDTEIVVPEAVPDNYPDPTLSGQNFTIIAGGAFANLDKLTKVTIGNNVNHIGFDAPYGAFSGCEALQELTIGNNLDYLANSSLYGCDNLTTFTCTSTREGDFQELERYGDGGLTVRCYHTTPLTLYLYRMNKIGKNFTLEFLDENIVHIYSATGICLYCGASDPDYFTYLYNNADNTSIIAEKTDRYATVVLQDRTLWKDGTWNTICLPFDWMINDLPDNPFAGATVRTLSSATLEDGLLTLNFAEPVTGRMQPGVPYIVRWDEGDNIVNPCFKDAFIESEMQPVVTNVVTFQGTYAPIVFDSSGDPTKLYLGGGDKLYYPNTPMTIGAFRAYFQLADGIRANDPVNGIKGFVLNTDDDDATDISDLNDSEDLNDLKDVWFDLSGRRLSGKPSQKGVFIRKGRKEIIK